VPGASISRLGPPLRRLVRAALALEGLTAGDLTIVLGDDALLRTLNRRYRGLDRATDVLSFPYGDDEGSVVGDIVVSMERAAEQARRFRVTAGRELARLVVHGALHLAGLDHHTVRERQYMRRREAQAMRACAEAIRALSRWVG
jgi:probable rRNA maturation factor